MPLAKLFDYALPNDVEVQSGDRVVVPFGARQQLGVVVEHDITSALPASRMKAIAAVRDDAPRLPAEWLELMRFLATYYQRPLGETIISALPPRLRSVRPLPRKSASSIAPESGTTFVATHALTTDQASAVARIASTQASFGAFLLHGITGSGKTEVYLHLIAPVLEAGGQALVLVPEISLTPQLESRFRHAFPQTRLAVMHSGLEDVPRTTAWLEAARGHAGIVLGTRLGVLAPLPKLRLIVVDEEHDPSFKQQEGLRYSARDAAVYRARLVGCPIVLGTATPSLETWHNWRGGRYERLELSERAAPGARLPTVRTLDMGRGSCRDFAVLFVEAARTLGFGARLVSGYNFNPALQGQPGTTHAWAEVFVPGAGWITFDPTNRQMGGFNLIPVAVARNLSQAMPVSGSFVGGGDELLRLSVAVRVTQEPEPK